MAKYLHKYSSEGDFQSDYFGHGEATAITVNSARLYRACNDWEDMAERHDYDGTYVFDREEEITNATDCEGNPVDWFTRVKVFKNGNKEIYAPYLNDIEMWSYEDGSIEIIQDFSSIYQAGDGESHDFTLEYAEGPYHEPWVSSTEVNRICADSSWFDYVGEVDAYEYDDENDTDIYVGKMHAWEVSREAGDRYPVLTLTEAPTIGDEAYEGEPWTRRKYWYYRDVPYNITNIENGIKVDYNKPWYTVKVLTYIISEPSNLLADTSYYSSNTVSFNELLTPAFTAWGGRNNISVMFEDLGRVFMSGYCYSTSEELTKSNMRVFDSGVYDLQNERFVSNDRGQVIMIIVAPPPPELAG